MAHLPINHPLRPVYRGLAGACGAYVLIFGIVGLASGGGRPFFGSADLPTVLGLRANGAFSILSVIMGAVVLGAAIIGRNLDHFINMFASAVFMLAGLAMLTLLRTSVNVLGFTMSTCVVSFLFGLLLLTAGLYGKVGTVGQERAEEAFRHHAGPDSAPHGLGGHLDPKPPSQTEDHRFA